VIILVFVWCKSIYFWRRYKRKTIFTFLPGYSCSSLCFH